MSELIWLLTVQKALLAAGKSFDNGLVEMQCQPEYARARKIYESGGSDNEVRDLLDAAAGDKQMQGTV